MGIIKRLFICDRKKECAKRNGCRECHHTTDAAHAVNGPFKIEEENGQMIIPDNVKAYTHNDGSVFLVEIEEEDGR